jgi:hypothetical protein
MNGMPFRDQLNLRIATTAKAFNVQFVPRMGRHASAVTADTGR